MPAKTKIAKGISLSCMTVSDLSKAKDLFIDLLGLVVKDHQEANNWMEIGGEEGGLLGIGQQSKEECCSLLKVGSNAIVCIEVYDLNQAIKHLQSKNIKFHGEIIEIPNRSEDDSF